MDSIPMGDGVEEKTPVKLKQDTNVQIENTMGRPIKPFDWDRLDALCQYKAELLDCAELLKVSDDTVRKRIQDRYGITFTEYRNKKMAKTRMKLTQKALDMAFNGNNTMMIFALKNLCGWRDQIDINADVNMRMSKSINILLKDCSDEELTEKVIDISSTLKQIDEV